MGPEAVAAFQTAAPYIFAGGTAASLYGQHQQERQQRAILNRAMTQADADQAKGTAEALTEAQTMAPDQRAQALQAEQQAAFERAQADLSGAGGATIDAAQPRGGSADFIRLKGEREGQEGERLTAVARELSKLRGLSAMQQSEATRRSALAERLGSMWSSGRQRTQAAGMDAEAVDMPTIGQLGNIAQLVGGSGMMAGAGGAAGGATGGEILSGMDLAADGAAGMAAGTAAPSSSIWGRAAVMSSPMWQRRGQVSMFTGRK